MQGQGMSRSFAYSSLVALSSIFTVSGLIFSYYAVRAMREEAERKQKRSRDNGAKGRGKTASDGRSVMIEQKIGGPHPLVKSRSVSAVGGINGGTNRRRRMTSYKDHGLSKKEYERTLIKRQGSGGWNALGDNIEAFYSAVIAAASDRSRCWMEMTDEQMGKAGWDMIISRVKPIQVQAGGLSWKKRPLLSFPPDHVLKPLPSDGRGYRELAFYEKLNMSCDKYKRRKSAATAAAAEVEVEREVDLLR